MTVKAEQVGRNLVLTLEGVEPFVVRPLPGNAGLQVTETYLNGSMGGATPLELAASLMMAVDGAREIEGVWVPLPAEEQHNYRRIGNELALAEADSILNPAFFWQSVLGIDGVKAYIEGGEGLAGTVKALGALVQRLGRLNRPALPPTDSDDRTNAASTLNTFSLPSGEKPGRRPQDRQAKKKRRRRD